MSEDPTCGVCPCRRSDHAMAESVREWRKRGDYCTVCHQWCKEGER